jgi:apolipoprotein N-acyltransferase
VLLAASFPKFGQPGFAWPALAPLLVAVVLRARQPRASWRASFGLGVVTGLVYFGGALYWTIDVMTIYGGLGLPVAVLAAALLVTYLALYIGAVAALAGGAVRRFGVGGLWFAPAFWVAAEWTRGWLFGGFPWVPLGSSQATVLPIAQLASVTGGAGISALIALVGTAAAVAALTRRRAHLMGVAAVVALVFMVGGFGAWRMSANALAAGPSVRVGLVQGNIPQDQKWDDRYRDAIVQRYVTLSRLALAGGASVVIWPEASTPFFMNRDTAMSEPIRQLAAQSQTPFVIGTDEYDGARIYNAASVIRADGTFGPSYQKMHLVPFGEYVPLKRVLFFIGPLVQAVSDFSPGREARVLDLGNGIRAGVSICYESIYPALSRAFVRGGANLLVVITNDAWFGMSSAAFQHFEMGAMRAIEDGRYLVRAANTGITAVVDPYGRALQRADMFDALALTGDVRLLDGRTIYTTIGDVVPWTAIAITLAVGAALWRARRDTSST